MVEEESRTRRTLAVGLAMVASLWIHILLFSLLRYAEPLPAVPALAPVAIALELSAPPEPEPFPDQPKPPDRKESAVQDPAGAPESAPSEVRTPEQRQEKPGPPPEEETISLESKAPEYVPYLARVKAAIKSHWLFPAQAREKRQIGRLTAVFTLDKTGRLLKIVVEESSGHEILDHAALEAVRGAAPFPPFPDHINLLRLNVRANFDYRIRYVKVE
ncbi:MAG: energy transducer TonB [Thermodesulfobacteriota bacterium]